MPQVRRLAVLTAALSVLLAACTPEAEPEPPSPPQEEPAPPAAPSGATAAVVLPPATDLDPGHLEVLEGGIRQLTALAGPTIRDVRAVVPDTPAFTPDLVGTFAERSAQLVCVLGPDAVEHLEPFVALHPGVRFCAVPASAVATEAEQSPPDGILRLGVRVEELGHLIGLAARAAAGDGAVGLVLRGDELSGDRFRRGLLAGLAGGDVLRADTDAERDAGSETEALLDAGAVVVVVDGGRGAGEAARRAVMAGAAVLGPTGVVRELPTEAIVAAWRIRWSVVLAQAVEPSPDPPTPSGSSFGIADDVFEVSLGGALSPAATIDVERAREEIGQGTRDPFTVAPTATPPVAPVP